MARSTARKRALNTLYEADEKGQGLLSLLDERISHPGAQTALPDYAIQIVRGVADHKRTIDWALNEYSTRWKVFRMATVDRNILRMGVWEIVYNEDVPDKVAIDEALNLAKTLSDDDSPSFIHGLLSAIRVHKGDIASRGESEEQPQTEEKPAPVPVDNADNSLRTNHPMTSNPTESTLEEEDGAPILAQEDNAMDSTDGGKNVGDHLAMKKAAEENPSEENTHDTGVVEETDTAGQDGIKEPVK